MASRGMKKMDSVDSDYLCRQIVAGAQDAIIFADQAGIIKLWNTGAETLFGYRQSEALGESLDLIIPENLRQRHWEGYRRVMATGVSRYTQKLLAVPGMRRDGTRLSLEFTMVFVRNPVNDLLGVAAIIRDVTERWQQEQALKRQLADLKK